MCAKTQVTVQKVHTYTGHKDAIYTLEPGEKENIFYSAGGDGHVIEWDLNNFESGRLIAKIPTSVYGLHFLAERGILIIGQNYEGIHLINVADLSIVGSLKLTKNAIFDIKVFENLIIVAAGNGELFVVDLDTLQIVKKSSIAEKNLRTIFITEKKKCLIGTSEGKIIQIDLGTLKIEKEILGHDNSVFSLASSSNEPLMVSGSRDAKLKFWDIETLSITESINAHMYAINDIKFHKSGLHFATASMDKTIKIWDYKKKKLIKVIDKARHQGHLTSVNKLVWSSHNDYLISCSDDRSIGVWSIDIGK
ncbi:MAG: WD40 repeat domain-containing protein [Reichenbachiella sp.]